eukprot:g16037.t1
MSSKNGRDAFRGVEVHTLDLIFESLTSEQWAKLLKAPLAHAVADGNTHLAKRLVGAGGEFEDALLHEAVRGGHRGTVSDMLEGGASIDTTDADGSTPLHVAAESGETEMVQLFLAKGSDKNAFGKFNSTPLYLAAGEGHLAAVQALLAAGADASLPCGQFEEFRVLHAAAEKGHIDVLRAVIEHGAVVDAIDFEKETALHTAAWHNAIEAIHVLVEAGATNIEAPNAFDDQPLHLACEEVSRQPLLYLLEHGADVNA